jgi:hypothetical protein
MTDDTAAQAAEMLSLPLERDDFMDRLNDEMEIKRLRAAAEMLATLELMEIEYELLDLIRSAPRKWTCYWRDRGTTYRGSGSTAPEAVAACWAKGNLQ